MITIDQIKSQDTYLRDRLGSLTDKPFLEIELVRVLATINLEAWLNEEEDTIQLPEGFSVVLDLETTTDGIETGIRKFSQAPRAQIEAIMDVDTYNRILSRQSKIKRDYRD